MKRLYYIPPTDKQFEELKYEAIKIWKSYDDTYGYTTGKIARIKDIKNVEDNFMYIVAMFDGDNRLKLFMAISTQTFQSVRERLIDGGGGMMP